MKYNGLPLINLDITDGIQGVQVISLVDEPAVERDFIKFAKDAEIKFKVNEEKRIITGVALIPNQKIYRKDPDGKEYYAQFSKDAVERIAIKFFQNRHSADANLMHEFGVEGVTYFESYLTNKARGILPAEFADVPDGTWIVSAKIDNDDVWSLIKQGVLRGFSIEGRLGVKEEISSIEELMDMLEKYN